MRSTGSSRRGFRALAREHRSSLALCLLWALAAAMAEVASVGVVVAVVGALAGGGATLRGPLGRWGAAWESVPSEHQHLLLVGLIIGVALAGLWAKWGFARAVATLQARINISIKESLLRRVLSMELLGFQRHRVADLLTYLGPHSNNVGEMANSVVSPLPKAFGLLLVLSLAVTLSVPMTAVAVALFAGIWLALRGWFRKQQEVGREQKEAVKEANFQALETLQGFRAIRLFARETFFATRVHKAFLKLNQIVRRKAVLVGLTPSLNEAAAMVAAGGILLVFGLTRGSGPGLLAQFVTFFYLLLRTVGYAGALLSVRSAISVTLPTSEEIMTFLADPVPTEEETGGAQVPERFSDRLELRGVGFRYAETDVFAMRDIDLVIPRGARIGVAGASGSGKSTLVDLLVRILEPTEGELTLDGVGARGYGLGSWRRLFAVVPQEAFLLNDTIAENIRFGNPELDDNDVRNAAAAASILDFVDELPAGLETKVGDRGTRLSGGQRQRLAIARALANQRQILIFDEATSSLDGQAEESVHRSIDALPSGVTIVIVAHRLSTLRGCDEIAVLDDGRLVERGAPAELQSRGGIFSRMLEQQGLRW